MLALSRKIGEKIIIGDNIAIKIFEIKGDTVRIGIEAPKDIKIYRGELYDAIAAENKTAHAIPANFTGLEQLLKTKDTKKTLKIDKKI